MIKKHLKRLTRWLTLKLLVLLDGDLTQMRDILTNLEYKESRRMFKDFRKMDDPGHNLTINTISWDYRNTVKINKIN